MDANDQVLIRCEILPVALIDGRVIHLRPERPWWVYQPPGLHPTTVVAAALARALGAAYDSSGTLVHSTSWRFDDGRLILTFLALLPVASSLTCPPGFSLVEVSPHAMPAEPSVISVAQVVAHGLRHFALLRLTDPQIAGTLADQWHQALAGWAPLPAGLLDHYGVLAGAGRPG
ncbi:MAG: hypothetical protein ACRD0K_02935 [Egibacteraceae bacterium]